MVIDVDISQPREPPEPAIRLSQQKDEEDHVPDDATTGQFSLRLDAITGNIPVYGGDEISEKGCSVDHVPVLSRSRSSSISIGTVDTNDTGASFESYTLNGPQHNIRNREWDTESVGKANPQRHAQRVRHLVALGAEFVGEGIEIDQDEQQRRIHRLARATAHKQELVSFRFDRLASFCLLHYQHELIKLDEDITQSGGIISDAAELRRLRLLLLEYCEFFLTS